MRHYQSTVVTRVKISHRIRLPLVLGSKPAWFFGVLLLMIVSTGLLPAAATQISGLESPQSFLADPATNLVVTMKDGKVYKNSLARGP